MFGMMRDGFLSCFWGGAGRSDTELSSNNGSSSSNGMTQIRSRPRDVIRADVNGRRVMPPSGKMIGSIRPEKCQPRSDIYLESDYDNYTRSRQVALLRRRLPLKNPITESVYSSGPSQRTRISRSRSPADDRYASRSRSPVEGHYNKTRVNSPAQFREIIRCHSPAQSQTHDFSPIYAQVIRYPRMEYSHGQYGRRFSMQEDGRPLRGILKKPREMSPYPNSEQDSARKREAFMELLAKRYPQYRDKISGTASEDGYPIRTRARDPQKRATVVTYNPGSVSAEYDDAETMSNIEGPVSNFSRGGYMRSSLPIVRSPPNTYERPMGFVFLIYKEETRRAVLPNEITHLDTVRAMFVRAFPKKLNLDMLESPRRKIYILEAKSSIYYQLEDLRDIRDRTVLKIHECDSFEPQKVKDPAPETRGKLVQPPVGQRVPGFPGESPATAITDHVRKAQTLPVSMAHSYPSYVELEYERPRSQTPDPTRLSRSQGSSSGTYGRVMYQSPERQMSVERPNLRPIPENHQMQNGFIPNSNSTYEELDGRGHPHYYQGHHRAMSPPGNRSQPPPGDPLRRALSPPPSGAFSQDYDHFRAPGGPAPGAPPQTYVAHGTRAATISVPLRATGPGSDPRHGMHPNRHSLAFTPMSDKPVSPTKPIVSNGVQRSQSYRVAPETERVAAIPQRPRSVTPQPVPPDVDTKFRMDKMEAQIANLAAWVQTAVVSTSSSRASSVRSGASTTPSEVAGSQFGSMPGKVEDEEGLEIKGLSDLSTASQTTLTPGIKEGILNIRKQTTELRSDLRNIRRLHQLNRESMQESIQDTLQKITKVLSTVPGAENQVLRKQRSETDTRLKSYIGDKEMAFRELSDLEACVEELRFDVLSRHCLVNMADVEGMALLLSQVARCFGELKGLFPTLQEDLKTVLAGEMEVVVKEEKFLKDEPDRLEEGLKRCKKLTNTLFTLKRLASVQEHRPHQKSGQILGGKLPSDQERKALLQNIQAMVPDHETRLHKLEEADASRERKKKIIVKQEALKFGRSLEMASRSLKPASSKEKIEKGSEVTGSQVIESQVTESQDLESTAKGVVHKPTSKTMDATRKSSSLPPMDSTKDSSSKNVLSEQRPYLVEKSHSLDQTDSKESAIMKKTAITVKAELPSGSKCVSAEGTSKSTVKSDRVTAGKPQSVNGKSMTSKRSKSVDSGAVEDKDVKKKAEILRIQKNAARANFFSSLTTPPTSPEEEKRTVSSPSSSKAMDYTVRISPVRVTSSGETQYTVTPAASSNNQHSSASGSKPTFLPVSAKKDKVADNKSATPSPTTPSYVITPGGSKASNIPRISPQKLSPGASVHTRDINVPKTASASSSVSSKDVGSASTNESSNAKSSKGDSATGVKNGDKAEKKGTSDLNTEVKPRKVPPPPPPRKSSRPVSGTMNPPMGSISPVRVETDPQDSSVVTGHQMGPANVGTLTSTPKASVAHKPTTRFEKDLAGGKSVSSIGNGERKTSNRTDTQCVKSDKTDIHPSKSEKGGTSSSVDNSDESAEAPVTESGVKREDRESSSESTTSSSSLDSQQGVVVLRCSSGGSASGGKSSKRPKPPPPARRSSLPLGNNPPVEKMSSSGKSKVNGRRESDGTMGD